MAPRAAARREHRPTAAPGAAPRRSGAPVHERHVQVEGATVEGLHGQLDPAHAEIALRAIGREREQAPPRTAITTRATATALRMVLTAHKLAAPCVGATVEGWDGHTRHERSDQHAPDGESVTEGTVLGWLKQVGDRVEADEPLVEISTDKVDAEVPAPVSGTLVNITAEADETVQVGSVLGEIEPDGDGAAPAAPDEAPEAGGEVVDVAFPEMGDSVAEGTVLEWRVKPGDAVAVDDPWSRSPRTRSTQSFRHRLPARSRRSSFRPTRPWPSDRCCAGLPLELEPPMAPSSRVRSRPIQGLLPQHRPRTVEMRHLWRRELRAPMASTWKRSPDPGRVGV